MAFEQATIKVEKAQEFAELRAAIEQAFLAANVERFLKQMDRKSVRVRDFDGVLAKKVLESVTGAKINAAQLYQALTLSDQAQMREFYLSKLETVEQSLRHKFKKLYQYY
jgi:Glu-tRNA(Gln) amidotransferase subunit E-like FAD-binding protein